MKGRVVVCKEYGKPCEIEAYDVPELASGAVLLRMTQVGICGSDLHVFRSDQKNVPLPPTCRRTRWEAVRPPRNSDAKVNRTPSIRYHAIRNSGEPDRHG